MSAFEDFVRDVRHAVRALARRPGFTLVAVITLALGIGASTAMFTLVDSVLLRPLAYPAPERLVAVWERNPGGEDNMTSPRNVTIWREQSGSFEGLAAWVERSANLTGVGDPAVVGLRWVTANYFAVLGERAHLGRTMLPEDDGGSYAVLSHGLWQRRYGGDPGVLGRTIRLNDEAYEVVGVMPAGFPSVGGQPEVWAGPHRVDREFPGRYLRAIARLSPGATLEEARAELAAVAARLAREDPAYYLNWGVNVVPLQEEVTGKARPALLVLLGAVSFLLVIACANVANLFLGRAAGRRKEMAVRRSLGARRGRLIAHSMAEALVVALAAGALGLLLAWLGTGAVVRAIPSDLALPRLDEVALDQRVLAFTTGVTLLTALLFGAVPAFTGSDVKLSGTLRDASRGSTGGRHRLRAALVVGEVALALVLLTGAGLLARTVHNLMQVDPGLRAEGVLTMTMTLGAQRYWQDRAVRAAFMDEMLARMEALPGATAAGAIGWLPLAGSKSSTAFRREDRPRPAPGEEPVADIRVIAGDYFAAAGIPLLRGRVFDASDGPGAPVRFIINEALAHRYFAGEDPLGRRIAYDWGDDVAGEIVGVVGSVREMALDREPSPAIYRVYALDPWPQVTTLIRTAGDPAVLGPAAAAALRDLDPDQPISDVRTLERVVADTVARERLSMMLLAGFAALSLLLVVIGMYGVISYWVAQRTREIGVRIALGAQPRDVLRMVVGNGMALTALGLALGLAGALVLSRLMAGLLFGVAPADPVSLAAACLILGATALLASFLPASRATRIDPARVVAAEP